MNRLILISGGIGAGKSVVCKVLSAMGYPVYDCDTQAKRLMDSSEELCRKIACALEDFSSEPILDANGKLRRDVLASVVFGNVRALKILNSIVHPAVIEHLLNWREKQSGICFVESAIPAESGLRDIVDEEWTVEAPEELRIKRVGERNGLSEEKIKQRILAQQSEWLSFHPRNRFIHNDGRHSVILQIKNLL